MKTKIWSVEKGMSWTNHFPLPPAPYMKTRIYMDSKFLAS
uniref:Uncharacterized protein n=1 Tax=Arundo donax TaxID=35708 RepID=A0A0A9GYP4_ARUDO